MSQALQPDRAQLRPRYEDPATQPGIPDSYFEAKVRMATPIADRFIMFCKGPPPPYVASTKVETVVDTPELQTIRVIFARVRSLSHAFAMRGSDLTSRVLLSGAARLLPHLHPGLQEAGSRVPVGCCLVRCSALTPAMLRPGAARAGRHLGGQCLHSRKGHLRGELPCFQCLCVRFPLLTQRAVLAPDLYLSARALGWRRAVL